MSQIVFDQIIASSTSGNQLAQILNDFKDAMMSGLVGPSRPAQTEIGGGWTDDSLLVSQNLLIYRVYTGTADVEVFRVNTSTGVASIASSDSLFEIAKVSADSVGPILKLSKDRIANNGQTLQFDVLGEIQFRSSADDLSSPLSARVSAISSNNTTATQAGSDLVFEIIKKNESALSEAMRINENGVNVTNLNVTNLVATNTELGTVTEVVDAQMLLNKGGTQTMANTAKAGFKVEMTDATDAILGYDSSKASKFVIGNEGSEKEIATVSDTQTLTNKTISGTTNTITNIDATTSLKNSEVVAEKILVTDGAGNFIYKLLWELMGLDVKHFGRVTATIPSATYTELVSSTSTEIKKMDFSDSYGAAIGIYKGGAGSEVQIGFVSLGGGSLEFRNSIPSGTRISIKSLTTDLSGNEFNYHLLG